MADLDPASLTGLGNLTDPDAITDGVLAAAIRVFSHEPTSQVTLKRVALEAGVAFEAVSERWTTTTDLLADAVERLTDDLARSATCDVVPLRGGALSARQDELLDQTVHLLARASMDGIDALQLKGRFPMIERLHHQVAATGVDEQTARYRVFGVLLMEFGLRLFGDALLTACGLDAPGDEVRAAVDALQDGVVHTAA